MISKPIAIYYQILKYQPENIKKLHQNFNVIELRDPNEDSDDVLAQAVVLFAPLGYMISREKIKACPNLKVIVSNTTGHPHIDVEYAHSKGIYVACLKFAQDFLMRITPTAELTWGLLLALTRNIIPAHYATIEGMWDRRPFGGKSMLSSLSLGVVGYGRLGTLVACYGKAFGMNVRYYDPYVEISTEGTERVATLESLVEQSDVVTIHVPHEKETEGMFNRDVFSHFKQGSYFINTARGELIDWDSLLTSLKSGQLAGAALDVFEGEFIPGFQENFVNHPVLDYARTHNNLIITPHIGGSTIDAWRLTEAHAIDMALMHLETC